MPSSINAFSSTRTTEQTATETAQSPMNNTMPPPVPSTLEQKLQLLEARFTQPLGLFPETQQPHSNLSEHSFSFSASNGTAAGDNMNTAFAAATTASHEGYLSALSSPLSLSNNDSISHHQRRTSLELVQEAAAKHMRKVAANNNPNGTTTTAASTTASATMSPLAHSNSSQQTLVTGNHHRHASRGVSFAHPQQQPQQQQQQQQPQRVVAESPPTLVSPHPHGVVNMSTSGGCGASPPQQNQTSFAGTAVAPIITAEKPRVARTLLQNAASATAAGFHSTSSTTVRPRQQERTQSLSLAASHM
jgi:hypothetical protein